MATDNQRIVCAAIRRKSDGLLVCGARHFDNVMRPFFEDGSFVDADQGFIDQWGNFLNREDAYTVAMRQGQVRHRPKVESTFGRLYSEDLY